MEEIEITNGENIIDICYDDFASCLIIKKALAVNWPDCAGSVGEYYAISDLPVEERNFYTAKINQALSEGDDAAQSEAVKEWLALFADGKYTIAKFIADISQVYFLQSGGVSHAKRAAAGPDRSDWYFPSYTDDAWPHIFSITNDKIDDSRVEYYCRMIKGGGRPAAVVFEVSNLLSSDYSASYVLDGHHKILAYLKLKENIPMIRIMKHEACKDKTPLLLHAVKPVLTDFEYYHLFVNNDDNISAIDFINNDALTADLDHILKNAGSIDVSIINILKKYASISDLTAAEWLQHRLNILKQNNNVHLIGYGKGLTVYEKRENELSWFGRNVKSRAQLNEWVRETIR